jgi:hypothetical protein
MPVGLLTGIFLCVDFLLITPEQRTICNCCKAFPKHALPY